MKDHPLNAILKNTAPSKVAHNRNDRRAAGPGQHTIHMGAATPAHGSRMVAQNRAGGRNTRKICTAAPAHGSVAHNRSNRSAADSHRAARYNQLRLRSGYVHTTCTKDQDVVLQNLRKHTVFFDEVARIFEEAFMPVNVHYRTNALSCTVKCPSRTKHISRRSSLRRLFGGNMFPHANGHLCLLACLGSIICVGDTTSGNGWM